MQDERGALARGLVVVHQLSDTPGMSLEQLAKTTGYPKTSLFRIMRTLVEFSLVRRDADGRYQPLARIQPLTDTSFEDRLQQTMKRLAEETGQTVEWYESGPAGMVITRRLLPKNTEERRGHRPRRTDTQPVRARLPAFRALEQLALHAHLPRRVASAF